MKNGFEGLLEVFLEGFMANVEISVLLSFWVMFFYVMSMSFKVKQDDLTASLSRESFWGFFSSISSFLLVSVFLFLQASPLMVSSVGQSVVFGLSFQQFIGLVTILGWLLLAGYLYLPVKEKVIKNIDDEDISYAPFVGVFLGFCLSVLSFGDFKWPQELMALLFGIESVGQGAFYGFIFILPVVIVWAFLSFVFYSVLKLVLERFVPRAWTISLLGLTCLYQVIFQYL